MCDSIIGESRDGVTWKRILTFCLEPRYLSAVQGWALTKACVFMFTLGAGLAKSQHGELASFIAAMIPGKGLEAALQLSGISLQEEMALARRSGSFRRALRCLQALAAGARTNTAFRELPAWSNHLSEAHPLEMPAGEICLHDLPAINP